MKKILILPAAVFLMFITGIAFAAMSAGEIVEKANENAYYLGNDGKANVSMTIVDSQGRERKRSFTILRLDLENGGEQKFYVYFTAPADIEGMVYMVWKHTEKDDDRWMYLPGLDLVRRIAASDKRSSFAGSNFAYEDISGRAITEDRHELISDEGGRYKIRNTPVDSGSLEFDYFDVHIDKSNFLPVKAEYFNNGRLLKTIEVLEVRDIQGNPTAVKSKAVDLEGGSSTVMEFSGVEYDIGLEENVFTERYLRRPPWQWLK